jgi:hypothetical protein
MDAAASGSGEFGFWVGFDSEASGSWGIEAGIDVDFGFGS